MKSRYYGTHGTLVEGALLVDRVARHAAGDSIDSETEGRRGGQRKNKTRWGRCRVVGSDQITCLGAAGEVLPDAVRSFLPWRVSVRTEPPAPLRIITGGSVQIRSPSLIFLLHIRRENLETSPIPGKNGAFGAAHPPSRPLTRPPTPSRICKRNYHSVSVVYSTHLLQ